MTDQVFLGEVMQLYNKTGPGGSITLCQLKLEDTGRMLHRAVIGPIKIGDVVTLLDCEREHRRGRF
uniref:eS28 n=1 Tax=Paranosema locustae TaxID=235221 RepID=UPI00187D6DFD|nr:Chain SCC, eS28 [Paranosema locustae]